MTQNMGWGTPQGPPGAYGWGGWAPPPPPKPGVIPLAPLGLGDILGGSFATIGRHWKQLLGIALAVYGAAALVVGAAVGIAYMSVRGTIDRVAARPAEAPGRDEVVSLVITFGAVYLIGMLTLLVANSVIQASCPAVLQDAVLGRPTTFGRVWRRAWSRMPSVLGSVLLVSLISLIPLLLLATALIAMVVSFIAMAVDGSDGFLGLTLLGFLGALATGPLAAWLWVKFSFAPAAAVFEGQGALAAMSRSSQLVRGAWWRIFGISLLAYVMAWFASYIIQLPFSFLSWIPSVGMEEANSSGAALTIVITTMVFALVSQLIGQILTAAFPQLVVSLLYVDQRMRKENLAPALAEAAAVPPPPFTA
ncbi:DUF7847 domain-containing protein [Streptomyces sp. SP18CS02]|uniref:DUF7847 domain-containing protein n=1 Tax=Streptomyces sp. SP18CS02 TaxID=3002531 RepID=UPI002E785C52|nr:hypothetical protein [Streptomyces sp. SP18CS02]MEE1754895.1 hypothetical protein [Streptomyces sp. SP18CS02]